MFQLLVNADGGLTTAGYAVSALAVILLAAAVIFFCSTNVRRKISLCFNYL